MRFLARHSNLLHSCGMRHMTFLWLFALAGCGSTPKSAHLLAEAEPNQVVRLSLVGDRVVQTSVPVDFGNLPLLARTTCEAIAPGGILTFCGREKGPRGEGFRLEKIYEQPFAHMRSVLADAKGNVMERSHTLPLKKVPQQVLGVALATGTMVESAEIVSGPLREEFWRIVTQDRRGRIFVVTVSLNGTLISEQRRNQSRVDS